MSPAWVDRPIEVANLFNPAYCALVIRACSASYKQANGVGLPFALSFLALPLVLHPMLSIHLPATARTKLHVWLQEKPEVKYAFPRRVLETNRYTREALHFGMAHRGLEITKAGRIVPGKTKAKPAVFSNNSSVSQAQLRAALVGKLFAQLDNATSVFAMFGVRP